MTRVIGIFGSAGQVGATMVSRSMAEALSFAGYETLHISGSGKLGNDFTGAMDHVRSIDDLKADIINGSLEEEELKSVIVRRGCLSYLGSVRNPLAVRSFPPDSFERIISAAGEKYDYVIIDAGDNMNSGLAVSALNVCHRRIFVLTQQPKTIQRFINIDTNVVKALGLEAELIINRFVRNPGLYRQRDIEGMTGRSVLGKIWESEWGLFAETEEKTLMDVKSYRKEIGRILNAIGEEKRQPRLGRILSGRILKPCRKGKGEK